LSYYKIKDVRNNNTKYANFNYRYKAGDQIKIERKGTTLRYYHIDGNGNTMSTFFLMVYPWNVSPTTIKSRLSN
jgi:hypothetical protein